MRFEPASWSLRRQSRQRTRPASIEPLEERVALSISTGLAPSESEDALLATVVATPQMDMDHPGGMEDGITITDTEIHTSMDIIPRFAANPTITSMRSGNWSDPTIWSLGRVPTAGDRVVVMENTTILYNAVSSARIDALEVDGTLIFANNVNTKLTVANLQVLPSGFLQIGSEAAPIANNVTAEVVIADKALNLANDPRQFGTGLIVLGKLRMFGAPVAQTWTRLGAEVKAGDTSLLLTGLSSDWKAGDTLVLPDSRQLPTSDLERFTAGLIGSQWEQVVVDRVEGNRVFLRTAVQFAHLGARNTDGGLELLPHVALLTHNITVRSENARGTRGHTLYTARADVDIEYVRFQDLGRTDALRDLDNTTFDAHGNVTHYGTNQLARYAVHFHHLIGPENPTNSGYQFKFIGNSVIDSKKWAVDVHGSSYGLLDKNVVYGAQGAGFVTEDGTEIGNAFTNNIAIKIQGNSRDGKDGTAEGDYGRGGSGFWFRRGGNAVSGNVATDTTYAGFVVSGYSLPAEAMLPMYRGANPHVEGEGGAMSALTPPTTWMNNEAYGMSSRGLWMAYPNGDNLIANQPWTRIINLRLWNISFTGIVAYHTTRVTFDNLLILGDLNAQNRNDTGTRGMDLTLYENHDFVLKNSRIEGVRYGFMSPANDGTQVGTERPTILQNTILKNYINIFVTLPRDNRPSNGNILEVRDVRFTLITKLPVGPSPVAGLYPPANIQMYYGGDDRDLTERSIVRVYNYNKVAGVNFQVYYREQAPSYVMDSTGLQALFGRDEWMIGSPEAGLTNAQNWAKYQVALAGGVAPNNANVILPEINGLVGPIVLPGTASQVVLVTPWDNAIVGGNQPIRFRFNVLGLLPTGSKVYTVLDNGEPLTGYNDGGFFNIPNGMHTVKVYIGDANGQMLAGTVATVRKFLVTNAKLI